MRWGGTSTATQQGCRGETVVLKETSCVDKPQTVRGEGVGGRMCGLPADGFSAAMGGQRRNSHGRGGPGHSRHRRPRPRHGTSTGGRGRRRLRCRSRPLDGRRKVVRRTLPAESRSIRRHGKLLDRKDIDVVCIATRQYWHALGTISACQAGKQIYVEKPASALYLGRPADGQRGAALPAARPVRHAAALEQRHPRRRRVDPCGKLGEVDYPTPPSPTSPGSRSASEPSPCRFRPKWITISGAVRPEAADLPQQPPIRLQLRLEHRRRRIGQPRRPRDRYRPLDLGETELPRRVMALAADSS